MRVWQAAQLGPKSGTSRHGVRFSRKSTWNLSGMPTTTFANTVVNAAVVYTAHILMHAFAYLDLKENTPSVADIMSLGGGVVASVAAYAEAMGAMDVSPLNVMVRGDDMLAFADVSLVDTLSSLAKLLGFKPKIKHSHTVYEARFCSNIFWPVGLGYVPAPTYRCLMKIGTFQIGTKLKANHARELLRGKALGLLPAVNHVPLLFEAVQRILHDTIGLKGKFVALGRKLIEKKLIKPVSAKMNSDSYSFAAQVYKVSETTIRNMGEQLTEHNMSTIFRSPEAQLLELAVRRAEG